MKKSFTAQLGTAVFSKALVWGPQEIKVWVFFFFFFFIQALNWPAVTKPQTEVMSIMGFTTWK